MIRRAKTWDEYGAVKENQSLMSKGQQKMAIANPFLVFVIPPGRKTLAKKKRRKIFDRKGPNCAYCGIVLNLDTYTIDHVQALSKGGSDHPDNLTVACSPCNLSKGTSDV